MTAEQHDVLRSEQSAASRKGPARLRLLASLRSIVAVMPRTSAGAQNAFGKNRPLRPSHKASALLFSRIRGWSGIKTRGTMIELIANNVLH